MEWYHKSVFRWPWLYIVPAVCFSINLIVTIANDEKVSVASGALIYFIFFVSMLPIGYWLKKQALESEKKAEEIRLNKINGEAVFNQICNELIKININELAARRGELVYKNEEGYLIEDEWLEKGITDFITYKIRPHFTEDEQRMIDHKIKYLISKINNEVCIFRTKLTPHSGETDPLFR